MLLYADEKLEHIIWKSFYEDTKEYWSQIEQPTISDFIKWAMIKDLFRREMIIDVCSPHKEA